MRRPMLCPFQRILTVGAVFLAFTLGVGCGILFMMSGPKQQQQLGATPLLRASAPINSAPAPVVAEKVVAGGSGDSGSAAPPAAAAAAAPAPPAGAVTTRDDNKPKFVLPLGKIGGVMGGGGLGGGAMVQQHQQQRQQHEQQQAVPLPPTTTLGAGKPKRVYFTFTAGHSGEAFLAELLKVSRDMVVDREAPPSLVDFASQLYLGRKGTAEYRRQAKVPAVEARVESSGAYHYGDVNHMFAKSHADVVLEHFGGAGMREAYEVHVIILRRWLPETLQYWLLEEVWDPSAMDQYVGGEYTLHHAPFALLSPPGGKSYTEEDSISLIMGYLVDMEAQFAALKDAFPWVTYHEFRYEDLAAPGGTRRTLAALDLPITDPLDVARFEGTAVNDPLSWKDPELKAIPASVFKGAAEAWLGEAKAAGMVLPPLPHMARVVPCGELGTGGIWGGKPLALEEVGDAGGAEGARKLSAAAGGGGGGGGGGIGDALCGEPYVESSIAAAKAAAGAAVIKRNRVGPGKFTPAARVIPGYLDKLKAQWSSTISTFEKQRVEAEKYRKDIRKELRGGK